MQNNNKGFKWAIVYGVIAASKLIIEVLEISESYEDIQDFKTYKINGVAKMAAQSAYRRAGLLAIAQLLQVAATGYGLLPIQKIGLYISLCLSGAQIAELLSAIMDRVDRHRLKQYLKTTPLSDSQ